MQTEHSLKREWALMKQRGDGGNYRGHRVRKDGHLSRSSRVDMERKQMRNRGLPSREAQCAIIWTDLD